MQQARKPYVSPVISHLQFVSDSKVTMLASCKSTGDASGPAPSNCNNSGADSPCVDPIS